VGRIRGVESAILDIVPVDKVWMARTGGPGYSRPRVVLELREQIMRGVLIGMRVLCMNADGGISGAGNW
jgi:hypothetical protein